jgi:hypothetical protein
MDRLAARVSDHALEVVTTSSFLASIRIDGLDGKDSLFSDFESRLETRALHVGLERRGHLRVLFNVDFVRSIRDVLSNREKMDK